jgi:glycine/D-amino acid oxidase-like deaminating enzyme
MGAAVSYFLSRRGAKVTIIEACQVACGASGKSGGFLARSWCDGGATAQLAQVGFDLHRAWGTEGHAESNAHLCMCDYRPVTTLSVKQGHKSSARCARSHHRSRLAGAAEVSKNKGLVLPCQPGWTAM